MFALGCGARCGLHLPVSAVIAKWAPGRTYCLFIFPARRQQRSATSTIMTGVASFDKSQDRSRRFVVTPAQLLVPVVTTYKALAYNNVFGAVLPWRIYSEICVMHSNMRKAV